ncbi:MAG TPA: hypothetical protein VHR41_12295 [Gemmatimonadales bacterium]|nr:hypothetical protein [Gemmatimonadales bacterium]
MRRIGDAAVRARTGKSWAEWFAILDRASAASKSHREIVALLIARYELASWWRQTITVTYEEERGLRKRHQRSDGYEITRSKVVPASLVTLYRAWTDGRQRARWLSGVAFRVSTTTRGKSLRMVWEDGSRVDAGFASKGPGRSRVSVRHRKLASAADATRAKRYWTERLAVLADVLAVVT